MGRRTAVALAVIVPVLGSATWVWASEDDHTPVIHGCVQRHSGQLRIVGNGDRCRSDEAALSWNTAGPAGTPGAGGAAGPAGAAGPTGATGPAGPMGLTGATGPSGPAGLRGDSGPAGPQGDVGPAGPQGPAGATGPKGDAGPAGAPGERGPAGSEGTAGPAGAQGLTGPPGADGPAGSGGPAGPAGADGQAGPAGPQGLTGPAGPQGAAGANGVSGWEYVASSAVSLATGTTKSTTARCPDGKQIFGGGFTTPGTGVAIAESHPTFSPNTGWIVWARNTGPDSTLMAYALCAYAS